jgi:2-oxoglutarate ferredoxin oxidoreductase subunit gamma
MEPRNAQVELVIAGIGGRGVLLAGRVLVEAAMSEYRHVLSFANYAGAVRGGDCECTVILSDSEVSSPIMMRPPTVLILASSALKLFEERVKPGGTIVIDSTLVSARMNRQDVRAFYVPATARAASLGSSKIANLVLLGAYLELSKALPIGLVEEALERMMTSSKAAALLSSNKQAVNLGAQYMAEYMAGTAGR